jgi:Condensation domain
MVEQIRVRFNAEPRGPEPLSWGMWAQWKTYSLGKPLLSAGGTMKLDEGVTVGQLATMLRLIVSRHEALRTVIELDDQGEPRQRVLESAELVLEVEHAGAEADPAAVAEQIRARYAEKGWQLFHYDTVRMAVVCQAGKASHFVAMYNHFFIDGSGIEALARDVANLDLDTGRVLAPVPGLTPIEQVQAQQTAPALRQHNVSLRHWETTMRSMPVGLFADSDDKRSPRRWDATFHSPAAHLAVQAVMLRTQLHSSVIILAAYAKTLARISGKTMIVLRGLASNRYRPGLRDSVSAVVQSGLTVIDTSGCSFDELCDRAFRAQVAAGRHGYYDPRELWALMDRVAADRGETPDLTVYYNDRRLGAAQGPPEQAAPPPTRDQALALLPQSTLTWGEQEDMPDPAAAYLMVNPAQDAVDYTFFGDTHKVSPARIEAILREVENVVMEGAFPVD